MKEPPTLAGLKDGREGAASYGLAGETQTRGPPERGGEATDRAPEVEGGGAQAAVCRNLATGKLSSITA